jgi:integrase
MKINGFSKSMVCNTLACLSGALGYAILPLKYIKHNPCDHVKVGKVPLDKKAKEHTEYICSKSEFEVILNRFGVKSNFYLSLVVPYHLGTRLGETYGINLLEDVNFDTSEISINHQLTQEKNNWFYRPPKYESYRTIKMGKTIQQILKKETISRKENMIKYGNYYLKTYILPDNSIAQFRADIKMPYKEIMPLCVKENGELLTTHSFKYCARVIHHELNNELFHAHCLRHTHGTILAENGAFPNDVRDRLGHKDVQITLNKYVFNTDKMKNDTVTIFEQSIM